MNMQDQGTILPLDGIQELHWKWSAPGAKNIVKAGQALLHDTIQFLISRKCIVKR